jgi:hypothetical protein
MGLADKSLELSGFSAFTGTPEQVRKRLDRVDVEQVTLNPVQGRELLLATAISF